MPSHRDQDRKTRHQQAREAEAAAGELLPVVFQSLLRAGLTADALNDLVHQSLLEAKKVGELPTARMNRREDLDDLAHVLSVWHTDPRFIDNNGNPRKLRQAGRAPSLEQLTQIAIPSLPVEETLKRLLMLDAVNVDSHGRVQPLRRELVTSEWGELGVWNWRHSVRRYLETLEFNYTIPGEGRFERTARSERLPAHSLPLFNRWVREQAANFVQMVDDWLTQHEHPTNTDDTEETEMTVTAGVGVYLFVDDPEQRP